MKILSVDFDRILFSKVIQAMIKFIFFDGCNSMNKIFSDRLKSMAESWRSTRLTLVEPASGGPARSSIDQVAAAVCDTDVRDLNRVLALCF